MLRQRSLSMLLNVKDTCQQHFFSFQVFNNYITTWSCFSLQRDNNNNTKRRVSNTTVAGVQITHLQVHRLCIVCKAINVRNISIVYNYNNDNNNY